MRNRGIDGVNSSLKLASWDPRRANVSVQVQTQEKTHVPAQSSQKEEFPVTHPFCSIQAFSWAHPHWGGQAAWLCLLSQMLSSSKKDPHRHTQNCVQTSGPCSRPGPVKVTHKINHHRNNHRCRDFFFFAPAHSWVPESRVEVSLGGDEIRTN